MAKECNAYHTYTPYCVGSGNCGHPICPVCATTFVEAENIVCNKCSEVTTCSDCGEFPEGNLIHIPVKKHFVFDKGEKTKTLCSSCFLEYRKCSRCGVYSKTVKEDLCNTCRKQPSYCYYCQEVYMERELIDGVCQNCLRN